MQNSCVFSFLSPDAVRFLLFPAAQATPSALLPAASCSRLHSAARAISCSRLLAASATFGHFLHPATFGSPGRSLFPATGCLSHFRPFPAPDNIRLCPVAPCFWQLPALGCPSYSRLRSAPAFVIPCALATSGSTRLLKLLPAPVSPCIRQFPASLLHPALPSFPSYSRLPATPGSPCTRLIPAPG